MLAELKILVGVFAFVMMNHYLKSRYERQRVVRTKVMEKFYEVWEKSDPFYPYVVVSLKRLEQEVLKEFKLIVQINEKPIQVCVAEQLFRKIHKGEVVEVQYYKKLPNAVVIEKVSKI